MNEETSVNTGRRTPKSEQNWRERLSTLRYVPQMLKAVWDTHRYYTVAMIVLRAVRAFIPIIFLWVGKLIIDTIVAAYSGGGDYRKLWKLIALEIAVVVFRDLLNRLSDLVERLLSGLFD